MQIEKLKYGDLLAENIKDDYWVESYVFEPPVERDGVWEVVTKTRTGHLLKYKERDGKIYGFTNNETTLMSRDDPRYKV